MSKVLVTGADGFVGRRLCNMLQSCGFEVLGTTRSHGGRAASLGYELRTIGDIGDNPDWGPLLVGVDYIVHLAARVHVMKEIENDPLAAFRKVNVKGTETLLRSAGMHDVKRVIYVSTVKVHGDETPGEPFSLADDTSPSDPAS